MILHSEALAALMRLKNVEQFEISSEYIHNTVGLHKVNIKYDTMYDKYVIRLVKPSETVEA